MRPTPEDLEERAAAPQRRRTLAGFAAVGVLLVASLLLFAAGDDGGRPVGAPSFVPPSEAISSYAPQLPPIRARVQDVKPEVAIGPGRHRIRVEGLPLSFRVPASGWRRAGSLYLSKGSDPPQSADALLYWTTIDQGAYARPCGQWWGAPPGSTSDYVRSATNARGVATMVPARYEQVGGLDGDFGAFRVRRDVACQPGFFYRWQTASPGSAWTGIEVGDTVRIWVVDVGPKRLVIEADTHAGASQALTAELEHIVASIRFEMIG